MGSCQWRTQDLARGVGGRTIGGLEVTPQPPTNVYCFHIKTLTSAHFFFIKKGHAVSAVTMDNAKIFSQLMSKSRSLAKISKTWLKSLLLGEIIDRKLGFSTLVLGQGGGTWHWAPYHVCVLSSSKNIGEERLQTSCVPVKISVRSKKGPPCGPWPTG